eukprot:1694945-Karenia_brevis.AAC.1
MQNQTKYFHGPLNSQALARSQPHWPSTRDVDRRQLKAYHPMLLLQSLVIAEAVIYIYTLLHGVDAR